MLLMFPAIWSPGNENRSMQALLGFPQEYGVLEWLPEYGTHIRILPLSGDGDAAAPRSFHLPAMFNYHFVNVFNTTHAELGACMCIDAFYADSPASLNMFDLDTVRDANLENSQLILKCVILRASLPPLSIAPGPLLCFIRS